MKVFLNKSIIEFICISFKLNLNLNKINFLGATYSFTTRM